MPARRSSHRQQALAARGALHPHPERVRDALFQASVFFDPQDAVQVKYEMLRRVREEEAEVAQTAGAFGFSRPTFYQARAAFAHGGLPALVPRKRGPKGPHKLTAEVLAALAELRAEDGSALPARELARRLRREFGLTAHPRSIERGLARLRRQPGKKR
jgi:transposase-like protein